LPRKSSKVQIAYYANDVEKLFHFRGLFFGFPKVLFGKNVRITRSSDVSFLGPARIGFGSFLSARGGRIVFGKNFRGSQEVIYNCDNGGSLTFGNDCLVGPRCVFRTAEHIFSSLEKPVRSQGHAPMNIEIGNDVWFGANVIVLSGVTIGNHVVIGAGSVVTKSIADYSVAVGNPARVIRSRVE